ncbi:MAG: hypothetical protein MJ108_08010 [Saccharofermentans sp.]|nr:hypothetical protein [Saccharofermentans sp.]
MELDLDNLKKYCSYCGSKLMIDVENLSAVLIERERTKQLLSRYEEETIQRTNDSTDKTLAIMMVAICAAVAVIAICSVIKG